MFFVFAAVKNLGAVLAANKLFKVVVSVVDELGLGVVSILLGCDFGECNENISLSDIKASLDQGLHYLRSFFQNFWLSDLNVVLVSLGLEARLSMLLALLRSVALAIEASWLVRFFRQYGLDNLYRVYKGAQYLVLYLLLRLSHVRELRSF